MAEFAEGNRQAVMFSEVVLEHFQNPRNAGDLPRANTKIEVRNPVCGDILQLAAIVEESQIREVRFLCRGCTTAIACASILTEIIQGQLLSSIAAVHAAQISEALGGLPATTYHGAQLAVDGLKALLKAAGR